MKDDVTSLSLLMAFTLRKLVCLYSGQLTLATVELNIDVALSSRQELNGFYIPEMTSVACKSAEEMTRVLRAGNRQRASGRTDMNEHSSRSHAVFLVTVETAHRPTGRIRYAPPLPHHIDMG
ncbi:hypothetical protein ACJJTC_010550 [Scirpophaga incertulas]